MTRRLSLLELTSTTCRWPFGDPKDKDFGFCGAECPEHQPYCADHMAKSVGKSKTEPVLEEAA